MIKLWFVSVVVDFYYFLYYTAISHMKSDVAFFR